MAGLTQTPATAEDRLEAENAVIGSMLIDEDVVPAILSKVDANDFAVAINRKIFQAARALLRDGSPVDAITLRDKVGGDVGAYFVQLMDVTPTSANWEAYADIMRQRATVERVRALGQSLAQSTDLDECRDQAAKLQQVMAGRQKLEVWSMSDVLAYFQRHQVEENKTADYIKYGIKEIDDSTYTRKGNVVIIGGYPSDGKTAFGLRLALHMAKTHKVGFFSIETDNETLGDRIITSSMQIDFNTIKRRALTEGDWTSFAECGSDLMSRNLHLVPGSSMTASQIQAISQTLGFDVIFIDYVQLVTPEGDPRAGSVQLMSGVSKAFHAWAQSSKTLVVELAQLSRPERGKWRKPNMHDLRETGQFEQDADLIFLLYRPKPGGDYDQSTTRILTIAKQKEGNLGDWPLYFDGSHQCFSILAGKDGKSMRDYADKGKAAKQLRRSGISGQQKIREIQDTGDMPF